MSWRDGASGWSEESDQPTPSRPAMDRGPLRIVPSPAFLEPPVCPERPGPDVLATPRRCAGEGEAGARSRAGRYRRPRRVAVRIAAVAALGALPWVAPQLPALIAAAVPASGGVEAHALSPIGSEAPLPPVFRSVPSIAGPGWAAVGAPLKVIIPRLRISSSVVPISGRSGELVPPGDAKLLGWWKEGAPAGSATGSTVITGHTVSAGGGAFDHLGDLRSGDRVRLRTAAGAIDYVVRQARDVPVADLARAAGSIFSQTVPGRLVLVTCSDFNGTVYLSNAVVYADPVLAVLGSDH